LVCAGVRIHVEADVADGPRSQSGAQIAMYAPAAIDLKRDQADIGNPYILAPKRVLACRLVERRSGIALAREELKSGQAREPVVRVLGPGLVRAGTIAAIFFVRLVREHHRFRIMRRFPSDPAHALWRVVIADAFKVAEAMARPEDDSQLAFLVVLVGTPVIAG